MNHVENNPDPDWLPAVTDYEIKRFSDLVSIIQNELKCGHWLFRGLKSVRYRLIPTLARLEIPKAEIYEYEMTMLRKTFAGAVDQDAGAHSDINQLLLAQHHGAPTRLLDWTSSALVAAYFASEPRGGDDDFKIVAAHVCPQSAGFTHFSVHDLRDVDFFDGYFDAKEAKVLAVEERKSLKDELNKRGTIFVQGSDISPRVAAQQGFVSIQRDICDPLDTQQSENITNVVHIRVKASAREEFQDTLYQLGIRRRSLFPEVDALFGEYAKEQEIHDRLCDQCSADDLEDGITSQFP